MRSNRADRAAFGLRRAAAHDLRHRAQLFQSEALHHAFGAERHLQLAPLRVQISRQPVGGAGKHRRAQHDKLPVGQTRQQGVDASLHHATHRIEKFVDRRADGDDHRSAGRNAVRAIGEHQALGGERLGQHACRAVFDEWQAAGLQRIQVGLIEVVDVDPHAGLGQRQHQRNADMAGSAHDGDVGVFDAWLARQVRRCRGGRS